VFRAGSGDFGVRTWRANVCSQQKNSLNDSNYAGALELEEAFSVIWHDHLFELMVDFM
jgi:hypothetical protein